MSIDKVDNPENTLENWKRNTQIEWLLETGGDWTPAKLADEIEGVLRGLLIRGINWQINAALNTIFPESCRRVASRYPYTVAEVVLKRLLQADEAEVRERLTGSLMSRITTWTGFMQLIGDVIELVPGRNEHLISLLLFVSCCPDSFSEAQLVILARELKSCAVHTLEILLVDKSVRSVQAAIILLGFSSEDVQEQGVVLLREHYEQRESQMEDAIREGLAHVLPVGVKRMTTHAISALLEWAVSLRAENTKEDQLLGEFLVKACQAELETRRS